MKGHQGERGNEEADKRAKREVEMGWRLQKAVIATPAGIKQELPIYPKIPVHLVKGLVYMVTDKGPQRQCPSKHRAFVRVPMGG